MRAAILGDIIGSRFERSKWQGASFEEAVCIGYDVDDPRSNASGERATSFELITDDCHLTDDSVLQLAVIEWMMRGGNLAEYLKKQFHECGRPELFGRFFRAWAESNSDVPCGSFGNGAAMRVHPVGIVERSFEAVVMKSRESAEVTHTVDHAVDGAEAIALGVLLAKILPEKDQIIDAIRPRYDWGDKLSTPLDEVRNGYEFSSACPLTVPYAFRAFIESSSYEETIRRAISIGGDSDTIACMAGGIAGTFYGVPAELQAEVDRFLNAEQLELLEEFEKRYPKSCITSF